MTVELDPDVKRLLRDVEAACVRHNLTPTQFGIRAINDGHLITHLRSGRSPTLRTMARVRAYLWSLRKPDD